MKCFVLGEGKHLGSHFKLQAVLDFGLGTKKWRVTLFLSIDFRETKNTFIRNGELDLRNVQIVALKV